MGIGGELGNGRAARSADRLKAEGLLVFVSYFATRLPLCRPGDDLLSRVLRQSTIGAEAFDGRVRDGIGSALRNSHQASEGRKERIFDSRVAGVRVRRPSRQRRRLPPMSHGALRALTRTVFAFASLGWTMRLANESDQVERAISTGKLHALLRFHTRPIDVVVFHGSSGRTGFEAGFPLRCLQRLSIPYIATLHCGWRHNRSTRDTFTPVLSY